MNLLTQIIATGIVIGIVILIYDRYIKNKNYSERDTSHPVFGKTNLNYVLGEAWNAQRMQHQVGEKLDKLEEKEHNVKSNKEHSQKYIELKRDDFYYAAKRRRNTELLDHMLEANISVVNGRKTISEARKEFDSKERKYTFYDENEIVREKMSYWLSK